MNAIQPAVSEIAAPLHQAFDLQRQAYLAAPVPNYSERKQDLQRLKSMLSDNREAIIDAICQDYGNRSRHESLFAEIIAVTDAINDVIKHLKKWMRVQKRHVDHPMFPGVATVSFPSPWAWWESSYRGTFR